MKVCYLWIEKFKNFENFGINLSSDNKFHYCQEKHTLSKEDLKSYPTNFFGEKITDISALIGKNGSGKSNCLELICLLLKNAKKNIKSNFFIVTHQNDKYNCYLSEKSIKLKFNFDCKQSLYHTMVEELNVIFFTNIHDDRDKNFSKNIKDVSVNTLRSNIAKQIKVMGDFNFCSIGIEAHNDILVDISLNRNQTYLESNNFNELLGILRKRILELNSISRFECSISLSVIIDCMNEIEYHRQYKEKVNEDAGKILTNIKVKRLNTKTIIKKLNNTVLSCLDEIYNYESSGKNNKNKYKQILSDADLKNTTISSLITTTELYDDRLKISELDNGIIRHTHSFRIKFNQEEHQHTLLDFCRAFEHDSFVKVDWLGISSGHKAYLNIFSSLYSEIRRSDKPSIICIDEGDLFLHPKWQIEFIYNLLMYINKTSKGKIQLVLTSHSPFIISDLPKESVTVLDENMRIATSNTRKATFGANLYSLFSDNFFLGNNAMGKFASAKIYETLGVLKKDFPDQDELALLNAMYEIMGDELVKHQIKKRLKND